MRLGFRQKQKFRCTPRHPLQVRAASHVPGETFHVPGETLIWHKTRKRWINKHLTSMKVQVKRLGCNAWLKNDYVDGTRGPQYWVESTPITLRAVRNFQPLLLAIMENICPKLKGGILCKDELFFCFFPDDACK